MEGLLLPLREEYLPVPSASPILQRAFEFAPDAMIVTDRDGRIVLVNTHAEQMFGYERGQLLGQSVEILIPANYAASHTGHRRRYVAEPWARAMGAGLELSGRRKDGSEVPVDIMLVPLDTGDGIVVLAVVRDITERKQAEQALHVSEERLRLAVEAAGLGYFTHDALTGALACDESCAALFGGRPAEFRTLADVLARLHPDDFEWTRLAIQTALSGSHRWEAEFRIVEPGGAIRWLVGLGRVVRDDGPEPGTRFTGVTFDITDRKQVERLREKELLLKEIHHRVKNNLAVISSLFYLQSNYTNDTPTLRILQESQDRVRSMALVHDILYRSENLAAVDFAEYTRSLGQQLVRAYSLPLGSVRLRTHLEQIPLTIDLAVPCGLILNELITNALKHAFPDGRDGEIRLALHRTADGVCCLQVADNGVGVAPGAAVKSPESLGLRLVRTLVRQIDATFELIPTHPGTEARLTWKVESDAEPAQT